MQLREALTGRLPEAEQAIALAYTAPTSDESLSYLKRALRAEPFHHEVYTEFLGLLTMSGRFDQVRREAEIFKRIFPADPTPQLCLALIAAIEDDEPALEEALADLRGRLPTETLTPLKDIFSG